MAATWSTLAAVALGSALGGVGRYLGSGLAARLLGESLPWGTLMVNLCGSAAIGFIATLTAPEGRLLLGPTERQFLMIGVLGGFTTFSSFSLETLQLAQEGEWAIASAYVVGSLVLCLGGVWVGHVAAALLNR